MNLEGVVASGVLPKPRRLADRWVLSRLQEIFSKVNKALESYHFNDAASLIYQFTWHEFCDWYLEMIKPVLYGDDDKERKETQQFLLYGLSAVLRLLHPFMPYVTEELWHGIGHEGSIHLEPWPEADAAAAAEDEVTMVIQVNGKVRDRMYVCYPIFGWQVREDFERALSYRSLCCRIYGGSDKYLPIDEADVTPERLRLFESFTTIIGTTIRGEYLPLDVEPRPYASAATSAVSSALSTTPSWPASP